MQLQHWKPRLLKIMDAQPDQATGSRGPRPQAYQLLYDNLITWNATARIVIELSKRGNAVERARFIQEVYGLSLLTETSPRVPLVHSQIEAQLQFAEDKGYVETVPQTREALIRTTDRMLRELPYLRKIACLIRAPIQIDSAAQRYRKITSPEQI